MSIKEFAVVDAISSNDELKQITLHLDDDMVWIDGELSVQEHSQLLEKKINSYIQFIKSGEVHTHIPNSEDYVISILIQFTYKLPYNVEEAMQVLGDDLKAMDIKFNYTILQVI